MAIMCPQDALTMWYSPNNGNRMARTATISQHHYIMSCLMTLLFSNIVLSSKCSQQGLPVQGYMYNLILFSIVTVRWMTNSVFSL